MKKLVFLIILNQSLLGIPPYWNEGLAELAYYRLEQARYKEIHPGEVVLVTVSEPFRKKKQVKAEKEPQSDDTVVLKVIALHRFATGIYDYSVETSSFYDMIDQKLLKANLSAQDWCGQEFWQMNWDKNSYRLEWRSYFEDLGDGQIRIPSEFTEDEIIARLRLNPEQLPMGEINLIPSLKNFRLRRMERKIHKAMAKKYNVSLNLTAYEIQYPQTTITFVYETKFPHTIREIIEKEETQDKENKSLTSRMVLQKKERLAYWNLNRKQDLPKRKALGLHWP